MNEGFWLGVLLGCIGTVVVGCVVVFIVSCFIGMTGGRWL